MLHLLLAVAWIFQTAQPPPAVKPSPPIEVKPLRHVPFPRVKDWKSVKITLQRNACYGNCPWYRVEVRGDGSVFYEGKSHVAVKGHHRGLVPRENVLELVKVFEQTDYYSLLDQYSPCPIDTEIQVTSIEIDGRSKQVTSCAAGEIGTPVAVSDLELAIDRLAGSARWTRGNAETRATLEAEHWDFKSAEAAATLARVAQYGNADGVRALVSKGVPINGKNDLGNTTLVQAARQGDVAMLRPLLGAGAAVNRRDLAHAVVSAAHSGKVEALRLLLRRGGRLNSRDQYGRTVLMAAATSGSPAMVREILKSHPNVNAKASCHHCEHDSRTALMEVAAHDFWGIASEDVLGVAQLLIQSGADVNARDKHGNTALILCVRHRHKLALPLIQAGADRNARNDEGNTALSNAYDDTLKRLLMEHGAVHR
jgi:ankyrin repeat protein